jgi:hypothetical protein
MLACQKELRMTFPWMVPSKPQEGIKILRGVAVIIPLLISGGSREKRVSGVSRL